MGQKGLDFKHKEVININDGRRLRVCAGCYCGFGDRGNYIYYCTTEIINFLICLQGIMILLFLGNRYDVFGDDIILVEI